MNELHLFAGAGGGILAGQLLGHRCIGAVEIDPYCQAVLVARQDDGTLEPFPIFPDVRTFDGRPWRGIVDVVAGGFPCQAYSSASAGRYVTDDLWPEMGRVVADVAPRFVFAENTERRAINRAADDLEAMGYAVRCAMLSASHLGADHIRERYWVLAHADNGSELLRTVNAKMAELSCIPPRIWDRDPGNSGVSDGVAFRLDRIRAVGNGQVPAVAAAAFAMLAAEF